MMSDISVSFPPNVSPKLNNSLGDFDSGVLQVRSDE